MTDIVERLAGTFRAEPAAQRVMDEDTDLITALRAEVEWYKEHSARVQEVTATYTRTIMQYRAETARLTARIRELEGALGFYANPANRRDGRFKHQVDPDNGHNVLVSIPSSYIKDGGKRATAALRAEVETLREIQRNALVEQGEEVSRLRAEVDTAAEMLREVKVRNTKLQAENEKLRAALGRARTVLGNMALEYKGAIFNRWPINHEPLRADAKNLLPVIDAALKPTAALRAENEKLRAALKLFACDCAEDDLCKFLHACRNYVARAALEEKQ